MNESLNAIKNLNTEFLVIRRIDGELVLSVSVVDAGDVISPAKLKFSGYRSWWGSRWDSVEGCWQNVPELATPDSGFIGEVFIKRIASGIKFSFSDGREPVVRWGFMADGVSVEQATGIWPNGFSL